MVQPTISTQPTRNSVLLPRDDLDVSSSAYVFTYSILSSGDYITSVRTIHPSGADTTIVRTLTNGGAGTSIVSTVTKFRQNESTRSLTKPSQTSQTGEYEYNSPQTPIGSTVGAVIAACIAFILVVVAWALYRRHRHRQRRNFNAPPMENIAHPISSFFKLKTTNNDNPAIPRSAFRLGRGACITPVAELEVPIHELESRNSGMARK